MPKLYSIWPANNRFYPCGCISGPLADLGANSCLYICIIGILIPYFIFVVKEIWKISPAIPLLFLCSILLTLFFLNLTQCTDPGIIPRRAFLSKNLDKYEKYLIENNQGEKYRFCTTCKIFRPPRASHCSTCDNCVEVFDHHCPFVNNCVGKRNYRFFVSFLASIMLTIVALIINLIVYFVEKSGSQVNSVLIIIVCAVIVGIITVPLLGFFIFHLFLAITGRTTRQIIKSIKNQQKHQNQWFKVDPPLVNYFEQISQQQIDRIKNELNDINSYPPTAHNKMVDSQ